MPVARRSISLSFELDQALDVLVARSGQPKSKLIELLLRENLLVQRTVESIRLEFATSPVAVPGKRGERVTGRGRAAQRA